MVPAFVLGIALSVLASAGATQTVTVASLLESLATEQAGPKVRSLSSAAKRGIAIEGPLPPDLDLPKVNLTINFEFDSTRLTTDAMLILRALGTALQHPQLADYQFQIAGHSSAEGSDAYNLDLSTRRTQTVVDHLATFYSIPAERLLPVGYGETQLLYPDIPDSELNRRVTVINLSPFMN
jgi:outer membrane protein OmpA-like peptidoglycan-associated protein